MKTTIKKLGLLVAMLLAILPISAYDFEVDGIYYQITSMSDMTCKVVEGDSKYEGDIVIPSEVTYRDRQFSVTEIVYGTFMNSQITSVIIPNSITTIYEDTFRKCSSLTSVTIPDSVIEIQGGAFEYCTSLKNINIPNSVIRIGRGAFYHCTALETMDIPDSVTTIEGGNIGAFEGCTALTYINIPPSLSYIPANMFYDCESLPSVSIPNSIISIGSGAFAGCKSLVTITIPNSVERIGTNAFASCESLTSIKLSDNLIEIDYGLFSNCKSLEKLEIPGSVQKLEQYWDNYGNRRCETFANCDNLTYLRLSPSSDDLSTGYFCNYKIGDTLRGEYTISDWEVGTNSIKELYIDRHLEKAISVPNLEILEVGSSINSVDIENIANLKNLTTIKCHALVPPSLKGVSNEQYMDLLVFVPEDALETYKANPAWGAFWNLQGDSNLNSVESVNGILKKTVIGQYDLSGSRVDENFKGFVIVRFSDGSTKKILQK